MHNHEIQLNGFRACKYCRKSQKDSRRQKLSLESQDDICNDLISRYRLNCQYEFKEKGSAKNSDQRPMFEEMMKLIVSHKIDVIVCWKLHRLARNMKEGGWLVDLLQKGIIKAIVSNEKIYWPDDNTILQIIRFGEATQYSIDLSKDVKVGLDKKARKGIPNGKAIVGFLNNKHKDKGDRDWRDDPERLPVVKQIFREILKGKQSPHKIWKWARNDLKLTTVPREHTGGSLIGKSTFYSILRRPEYANFLYRNGQKYQIKCGITPIITEEEYWQIQDRLGKQGVPRPQKQLRTYSGFLHAPDGGLCGPDSKYHLVCDCKHKFSNKLRDYCPKCGKKEVKMENPIYRSYVFYFNIKRRKQGLPTRSIEQKKIDRFLISYARNHFTLSPELAQWSRDFLPELAKDELKIQKEQQEYRIAYLTSVRQKKVRAENAFLNGTFSEEKYNEVIAKLEKEEGTHVSKKQSADWLSEMHKILDLSENFEIIIKAGTTEEKREALSQLGSNLSWDEKNLSIYNKKWLDTLIEGLKGVKAKYEGFEPAESLEKQGDWVEFSQLFPELCGIWDNVRTSIMDGQSKKVEDS